MPIEGSVSIVLGHLLPSHLLQLYGPFAWASSYQVGGIGPHLPSYLALLSDQVQGKSLNSMGSFAFQKQIGTRRVMSISHD